MSRLRVLGAALQRRALSWPVFLCLVVAIVVYRYHDFLIRPDLRAEDGKRVFAYFYEHREVDALFRFKAGYLPLMPNLIGYLAVRLPARAMPYAITLIPTLLTVCTLSAFRAAAYRRYMPRDSLRFSLGLALAIAPIGGLFTVCHADYSIWNALLLLLFLVILPMPRRKLSALLFTLSLSVLIWSHPLSILALPPTLLWLWRDRPIYNRVLHGLLALGQLAHVWFGTEPQRAVFAKGHLALGRRLIDLAPRVLDHIVSGVIVPAVFPLPWASSTTTLSYALAGSFVVALCLCALLPIERVATRSLYLWVGYGILAPMTLVLLARAEPALDALRYHYVSQAFAVLGLCLVLWQFIFSISRRSLAKFSGFEVLPTLLTLGYFVQLARVAPGQDRYRRFDPENSDIVAKFFADLADAERDQNGHCGILLLCQKKHRDWSFALDTRNTCAK